MSNSLPDNFTQFYDDASDEDDKNDGIQRDLADDMNEFLEAQKMIQSFKEWKFISVVEKAALIR